MSSLCSVERLSHPIHHDPVHQHERTDVGVSSGGLRGREGSQGRTLAQCRGQFLSLTRIEVLTRSLTYEYRARDPLDDTL